MSTEDVKIIWIVNPLNYKINNPSTNKVHVDVDEQKYYNYNYYYDFRESYNDFRIPSGRKRSPSFMKTMFSHS